MNEKIAIAKSRKDGKWVFLSTPDASYSEANDAFSEASGQVSEDYSRIILCELRHLRPESKPLTKKQQEQNLAQVSERTKRVEEIASSARDRQKQADADLAAVGEGQRKLERARAEEIAERVRANGGKATAEASKAAAAAMDKPKAVLVEA